LTAFAKENQVDLAIVASDDPQEAGVVNALQSAGIPAFGATREASAIEWSKSFAKALCRDHGIPTARFESFSDSDLAITFLDTLSPPYVIKADGLALGKGVVIAQTREEAMAAIADMLDNNQFGSAGHRIVIEEFLPGREVTVMVFTDGESWVAMPPCRDHKRIGDEDTGPNTGGMGVVSPVGDYTREIHQFAVQTIIEPTLAAMRKRGTPFTAVLYFELMLTANGPMVIEFNARFGDPECQVVLLLLETDLLEIFQAVCQKRLGALEVKFSSDAAAIVMAASAGYPGTPDKGYPISGIPENTSSRVVFHSGTQCTQTGFINSGGRVLGVSAKATTLRHALDSAYDGIRQVSFQGMQYRNDIGKREIYETRNSK
jgi:phosphoribosylamine--glycine ligase